MPENIDLSDQEPIAAGSERELFFHPGDPNRLIKVLIPADRQRLKNRLRRLSARIMPSLRLRSLRLEYAVYTKAMRSADKHKSRLPITHMYGFVDTDRGLGFMVERIRGVDQPLGPTLAQLVRAGRFEDRHLALFNDAILRISLWQLRTSDLSPRNFVFGHRGEGAEECVLVDGCGDTHVIPIRSLSNFTNQIANSIEYKHHAAKLGLIWNRKTYQYSRA